MEIKLSTALETALEFISEIVTCKDEELEEKVCLSISFIHSLKEEIPERDYERLIDAHIGVTRVRRRVKIYKREGK